MYIDLLTKIKNAEQAQKDTLKASFSKMDYAIVELLQHRGFLKKVEVKGRTYRKYLQLELNLEKPISGVKFLSKPSLSRYAPWREIRPIKGGYGLLILSTPQGIMTGEEARKKKVGGELLVEIW